MDERPFGIAGEEYWTNPWKNLDEIAFDRVADRKVSGIAIDAPATVPLDARRTLPLLVYYSGSNAEMAGAPFEQHGVLALVNLDDDMLLAAPAIVKDGPPMSMGSLAEEPGHSGREFTLDVLEALGLEAKPARYLVTALLRDSVSNRLHVALVPGPAAYADPEVAKLIEAERLKRPPRRATEAPGSLELVFEPPAGVPAIPAEPGIALGVERIVVRRDGAKAPLGVSFRVPVRRTDVIPRGEARAARTPTAVAAITLFVTGSEDPRPIALPLLAPSYAPLEGPDSAPIARGSFALDLLRHPQLRRPQTYFVYAFAGEFMAGPAPLAVVTEDMLPRR